MQGSRNKNAVLISVYCKRQKMRLNSTPHVVLKNSSINSISGQRIQTEQSRRIKTIRDQKFKLQYKSESREPLKSANHSRLMLSDQRKLSNYESHFHTSEIETDDKALIIHKMIFSVKSPLQSLRFQNSSVERKQQPLNITKRKLLRNSLFANPFQNPNALLTTFENGWSRKSSESLIFI